MLTAPRILSASEGLNHQRLALRKAAPKRLFQFPGGLYANRVNAERFGECGQIRLIGLARLETEAANDLAICAEKGQLEVLDSFPATVVDDQENDRKAQHRSDRQFSACLQIASIPAKTQDR